MLAWTIDISFSRRARATAADGQRAASRVIALLAAMAGFGVTRWHSYIKAPVR